MSIRSATCTQGIAPETLSALRDDLLPRDEAERLRRHIPACAACQQRLRTYDDVAAALRAQRVPPMRAELWRNLRRAHTLRADRHQQQIQRWSGLGAISAVLVAIIVIFVLLLPHGTTTQPAISSMQPTPTATMTAPTRVPTATVAPAATPTNIPPGWHVLTGRYFALAYPPEWLAQPPMPITDTTIANALGYTYTLAVASDGRTLSMLERRDSEIAGAYCRSDQGVTVTLAGVPMRYAITGNDTRDWVYADSLGTLFELTINDAQSPTHITLDNKLFATLRLADIIPFTC